MSFWFKYVSCLNSSKYFILLFWIFVLGISAWLGPKLIDETSYTLEPPSDSEAEAANEAYRSLGFASGDESDFALFIELKTENQSIIDPSNLISLQLLTTEVYNNVMNYPNPCVMSVDGYTTLLQRNLSDFAKQLVSSDNSSTLITIKINISYISSESTDFALWFDSAMTSNNTFLDQYPNFSMNLTGMPAFLPQLQSNVERDLMLTDAIALPLAMILFAFVLRSLRVMIVPIIGIAVCSLSSFAIMYGISVNGWIQISSLAPSLMMSICVSMSIDYSLFLLTRYREELLFNVAPRQAVEQMLASAGHTVLVSGITLGGCFLGLAVLPLGYARSTGIGCAITITIALLLNLTLTPSLLLAFERFFHAIATPFGCYFLMPHVPVIDGQQHNVKQRQQLETDANSLKSITSDSGSGLISPVKGRRTQKLSPNKIETPFPEIDRSSSVNDAVGINDGDDEWLLKDQQWHRESSLQQHDESHNTDKSIWYRWGRFLVQKRPWNFLLLGFVLTLFVPFGYFAIDFQTSDSLLMYLPRDGAVTQAFDDLCDKFGYGQIYPFKFIMEPNNTNFVAGNDTVLSPQYFTDSQHVISSLTRALYGNQTTIVGISYANGLNLDVQLVTSCQNPNNAAYNVTLCIEMRFLVSSFVNSEQSASWFLISLDFDPVSPQGKSWLLNARSTLRRLQSEGLAYNFYLAGIAADTHDTISAVYAAFPLMIGITGGLVLIFVGIAFRSLLIPLRSVLTIGLTIVFVYGIATLVYQYGILNWLNFAGLSSEPSAALVSLIPIIAFSIVVGVALDYDIFLLVRVREFRLSAHSTNESISRGLYKTGSIITAAGMIMFLAFGGLLFSHCALINQLAFFLSIAVLVDTFVVRAFIVPAMMGIFGDWNWWPVNLPTHSTGAESVLMAKKQLFDL